MSTFIIDGTHSVKVTDYDYKIDYSWEWYRLGNGKYKASDRGNTYDHYLSEITAKGRLDEIESLYTKLNGSSDLTLTDITEPLFGNNVDYSAPVTVVIDNIEMIEQDSFNSYSLKYSTRLVDCTFNDYTLDLPDLICLKHDFEKGTKYSNNTTSAYDRSNVTYNVLNLINGSFTGSFNLSYDELAQVLHFQRINRTLPFDMPTIGGVAYPFGVVTGNTDLRARLYSVTDINRISPNLFEATLTFVQD